MGSFLFNNNPLLTLELLEKLKALNYLTRSDANKEAKPMGMKIMPTKIKLVMTWTPKVFQKVEKEMIWVENEQMH
jgi:hypothetical protein